MDDRKPILGGGFSHYNVPINLKSVGQSWGYNLPRQSHWMIPVVLVVESLPVEVKVNSWYAYNKQIEIKNCL